MIRISVDDARKLRGICVERDAYCADKLHDLETDMQFWRAQAENARAMRVMLDNAIHRYLRSHV